MPSGARLRNQHGACQMDHSQSDAPGVHGLARLQRAPYSEIGVVTVPRDGDIRSAGDLPEHLVELHAFASRDSAECFAAGGGAAPNTVLASPACGPSG